MKKTVIAAGLLVAVAAVAKVESHWDGGRNTPVHRLALRDEFSDTIVPNAPNALPISTKQTCGQCHDYATIASGWHFNMSDTNAASGRPAQPWFLTDPVSGSQIPMGLRPWPGLYKPAQLGMTNWEFVYMFGRHMPGGDLADPADPYAEGGPNARWEVSGPIEINCFACHSRDEAYDHSEWARLIYRQNFRWAATGALGLGDVRGMGSRVDDFWGVLRGLNRDDSAYKVPPHVVYDHAKFDMKNRTVLNVGAPRNENCLNCHSTTQRGMHSKEIDGDVHLRAGMSCTDCHGNGLDHATARGFVGDNTGRMDTVRATASCAGCHIGSNTVKAGRHGAPSPKHVGFPLIHFKALDCTVCHAGVTENGALAQVRTSRANRMGIYGRARWVTPQPFILEPVFVRSRTGKISPRRMVWPAFWATRDPKDPAQLNPIKPQRILELCSGLLDVREQVGALLTLLATDPNIPGTPTLIVKGVALVKNEDGLAVPTEGETAKLPDGFHYKVGNSFIPVLPIFNPDISTEKMTDAQLAELEKNNRLLANLLQTLDASSRVPSGGFGAIAMGNKIYYRGGENDAVTSVAAAQPAQAPTLGWYVNNQFSRLVNDYVADNARQIAGSDCSLTEEMVAAGLKRLAEKGEANPLYVAHGQTWSLAEGRLVAKEEKSASAVSWPVGHDVRPARMARGAKPVKCADCHTVDSKFFFAKIHSTGPLLTTRQQVNAQCDYMGLSGNYNRLFGTTFLMRPLFKIFLWVVFGFILLVAIAFIAAALPSLLLPESAYVSPHQKNRKMLVLLDKGAAMGLCMASAYLAFSGLLGWFFHLMTGYVLILHMVAGGLFATCLVALIFFRGAKRIANHKRNTLWMIMLILGVLVLFTAVAPMMTWFGSEWQSVFVKGHRCATMCFIAISAWLLLSGGRKE